MYSAIFDLDGTLADTSGDMIAAANWCLGQLDLGGRNQETFLDPVKDFAVGMQGGRAMLRRGLSRIGAVDEDHIARLYPMFLERYGAHLSDHTRLFPYVKEKIAMLKTAGVRVAVCTNKPEKLALSLLDDLGVLDDFAAVVGAATVGVAKPDPKPYVEAVRRAGGQVLQSCMIGDTPTDHDTARAAGVPSVLVDFGAYGPKVADLKPDAILTDFRDLPEVLVAMIELSSTKAS